MNFILLLERIGINQLIRKNKYENKLCNNSLYELNEITHLLNLLIKKKRKQDEIVVLFDKKNVYEIHNDALNDIYIL